MAAPAAGSGAVLITRPEPGGAETAARVAALGWDPVLAPALVLQPRHFVMPAAQALLLTSRAAARALPAPIPGMKLLAVGEATAEAARERGWTTAEAAGGTAEDLARMAAAQLDPAAGPLLLAVGQGYALDLAADLRGLGFRVIRRIAYAAEPAESLPQEARDAVASGRVRYVLFHSPRSALCAMSLLRAAGLADAAAHMEVLAISRRVADAAAAALAPFAWRGIRIAARPDEGALLDLLGRREDPWQPERSHHVRRAMTPPKPTPSLLDRLRSFDPAVLPIAVAAIVLVVAVVWLISRPLPPPVAAGPDPQTVQELAALRAGQAQLEALAGRVAALEGRPVPAAPDLGPLREAVAGLQARPIPESPDLAPLREAIAALEARPLPQPPDLAPLREAIAALEARPVPQPPDLAPLREGLAAAEARAQAAERRAETAEQQIAALDQRLAELARDLAARPRFDPEAVAPRAALQQLAGRVETLAREAQATTNQREQRQAATDQAIGAFASRVAANEAALNQRSQSIEQLAGRLAQLEQQLAGRLAQLEQQLGGRLAQAEQGLGNRIGQVEQQLAQRGQAIEQQGQRLAGLEGTTQRLAALEGRAARAQALEAVQLALEGGQPLGAALRPLADPPRALTRFAETAPPTLAQLRLDFEEAARAALAASEPTRAGGSLLDGAAARLQGLVTVRRGEEVLWGDAAAAEIERARRALEAGGLEAALRHLGRLAPPAREAMAGWTGQAEALLAARDALRQMAAG